MSIRYDTPDRLQIQEGGGGFSVFGLPFFAAGVFLFLVVLGIVPMSNADDQPTILWPLLVLMAIAFTTVGGALVFGRSWMTIDRAQREIVKQWGLLVPLRGHSVPLEAYTAVTFFRESNTPNVAGRIVTRRAGYAGNRRGSPGRQRRQ